MKKYLVTPTATIPGGTGPAFPEIKETDMARVGVNAMEGDNAIVDDFIIKPGGQMVVEGGDFSLSGGMNVTIFKPLRAWRGSDGKEFADLSAAPTILTITAADPTYTRIDLIYAKFEEDVDGGLETRHYKEDPQDSGSLEGDVQSAFEKQNKLTILVLTGTPGMDAQAPDVPSDGAGMYQVTVSPGISDLVTTAIVDVRHNFDTLEEVNERLATLEDEVGVISNQKHRHPATDVDVAAPGNKLGSTAQDIFDFLAAKTDESTDDFIFRPEIVRTDVAPSHESSGKLGSVGYLDGATPAVDIPISRIIDFFGGARRAVGPTAFPSIVEGVNINARIVNKHADQATQSRSYSTPLNLAAIDSIQSDGGGAWNLLGYSMLSNRAQSYQGGRNACARDTTHIEVMGGGSGEGDSVWYTIDTVAGTVTQRVFNGWVPSWPIRGVFPTGDGTHVIFCQQPGSTYGAGGGRLEWFRTNCVTGLTTKYDTGTAPLTSDDVAPNIARFFAISPVPPGGEISGKVWDQTYDTGDPLEGALVTIFPISGGSETSQTTGVDGLFQFTGLAAGFYLLMANKVGYVGGDTQVNITASVGSGANIELPLDTGSVGTPGNGIGATAIGDLITPNIIFLACMTGSVQASNGQTPSFWAYHVDTDTFELLNTVSNPLFGRSNPKTADCSICMYKEGQALLFIGAPSPQTWIFDYATRAWTRLQISQPTAASGSYTAALKEPSVINVGGRVQMSSTTSTVWELTPSASPSWIDIGKQLGGGTTGGLMPGRGSTLFASLLEDGLPAGVGYAAGGRVNNAPTSTIYVLAAGGVVETTCGGVTGLTLGPGTTVVSFKLKDDIALPWTVGKVLAHASGTLMPGSIEISYSFDNDVTRQIVPRDVATTVQNSIANPNRKVWITLRGTQTNRPCINRLDEMFEQAAGAPGLTEVVVRFNIIQAGIRWVYMSREGHITIENSAQMTTPDKCLLMKVTPVAGPAAPTPFDYVNKRLIHRKYTATRAGGATPSVANDFPVLPSYIRNTLVDVGGALKELGDPTVAFDTSIAISGLTVDGQKYILELEG